MLIDLRRKAREMPAEASTQGIVSGLDLRLMCSHINSILLIVNGNRFTDSMSCHASSITSQTRVFHICAVAADMRFDRTYRTR
jgi:hypothetical protein